MAFRKIRAGLVKDDVEQFVGEIGNLFFDITDGTLRLSDGITPGGTIVSGGSGGSYTLPTASTTTKGGVKVDGTTITVNNQVISATQQDLSSYATQTYVTTRGYLTTETDPVFTASDAAGITSTDIANWGSAYSWGNHADAGYLTSTDSIIKVADSFGVGLPFQANVVADATNGITISTLTGIPMFATTKRWEFDYDGNLTFPDNTVQTTAWTGTSLSALSDVNIVGTPSNGHVLKYDAAEGHWAPAADLSGGGGGGLALSDLDAAVDNTPSGNGNFTYNDTTGVFTYTPPNLSAFLTSVSANNLTGTTLKSTVVSSSLTSVGTLTGLTVSGSTTLNGSLINGAVSKTGLALASLPTLGQSKVLTLTASPSNNGNWYDPGTFGPESLTLGDTTVTFTIFIDEGGNITFNVTSNNYGSVSVGQSASLSVVYMRNEIDVTVTVASVQTIALTAIDLTKTINKLSDGAYSLADGTEGQILYLTTQSTVTSPSTIVVTVANFRTTGSASTNYSLNPFVNGGSCRLLFTNGSWQSEIVTDISGNAATATTASAAPAGTLTGTTLASNVVSSSLTSVGTLSSLTVGGTIVGTQTTQAVFDTVATTVTAFRAATALTMGATTGTATIRNATVTLNNAATVNFNAGNPTLASTSTGTLTLFNTNLLTVNAFGAATSLTVGATTGTTTVRNGLTSTGIVRLNNAGAGSTYNHSSNAVNITGTLGVASNIFTNGNIDITAGSSYYIGGTAVLNGTTLGSGITTSSLTSVGTLSSLTVGGTTTISSGSLSVSSGSVTANSATAFIAGANAVSGIALQMPSEGAIRNLTNGLTNMYFDVSIGGSTQGQFQFRSSSSYTSVATMSSTAVSFNTGATVTARSASLARTAFNAAIDTEITVDNMRFRISNQGGIFPQVIGNGSSRNLAWTGVGAISGTAVTQVGSTGTIVSSSAWTTLYNSHGMDAAGDTVTITLQDKAGGAIYRITFMRSDNGSTTGYNIIGERLL